MTTDTGCAERGRPSLTAFAVDRSGGGLSGAVAPLCVSIVVGGAPPRTTNPSSSEKEGGSKGGEPTTPDRPPKGGMGSLRVADVDAVSLGGVVGTKASIRALTSPA